MTASGVSESGGEHEDTPSREDAEAHGTPRRRRRLTLRLPREARVGVAVSLSFGLLATVMVLNRPSKDKESSRPAPDLVIKGGKGAAEAQAKGPDGANGGEVAEKGPAEAGKSGATASGGQGSPGTGSSGATATGVASNTPKDGPPEAASAPPRAAGESPSPADHGQPVSARPADTAALPPMGESAVAPRPVEALALPPAGESAPPPSPVEAPSVAEGPKPTPTEAGNGQGAPAPVASGLPVEPKEPMPGVLAASSPETGDKPNVPAAVPLPSPADTGGGAVPGPTDGGLGPHLPAPGPVELPPGAPAPMPAEPSAPPMPIVAEPAPGPSTAGPPVNPIPQGVPQATPPVSEFAPAAAQPEARVTEAPPNPTAAAVSPIAATPAPVASAVSAAVVAPTESAVMPSSGNSAEAPGQEAWVKLPNTRLRHEADDHPAAPVTRAEPTAGTAAPGVGHELTDKIEPIPHVVQPGENFWTISRLYYRSGRYYKALWAANRDRVPNIRELYVGTTIRIPPHEDLDPALIEPATPKGAEGTTSSIVPLQRTSRPVVSEGSRPARPAKTVSRVEGGEQTALPTRDLADDAVPRRRPLDDVEDEAPESDTDRPRRPRYRVRSRYETIRSIAKATLGDAHREDEILRLNRKVVKDPYSLTPGQYLELPEDALIGGTTR